MNTRHTSRWFWLVLSAATAVVFPFFARSGATQKAPKDSTVRTANGLTVVTFTLPPGNIVVNLPDDIMAGDTISGTVIAEPKGQSKEERAKNQSELNGLVIGIDGKPVEYFSVMANEREAPIEFVRFFLYHTDEARLRANATNPKNATPRSISVSLAEGDSEIAHATIPIEMVSLSLQSTAPLKLPHLPSIGQQGRPIEIYGPFDGNITNTKLMYGRAGSSIQDFEKNTENVTAGFGLLGPLAESPRKCVFESPANVTGPVEIKLNEGNQETKGTYRNVGVNLTAPKTSLLKGESTELHVEVNGLQGITEPVPLHLTKGGVVTMQGGDVQTMSIKPSDVQSNGTFTTTRTITGVQAGAWNATATVVVFNFCLQDDNNGNLITFSSGTGDFIFCAGHPPASVFPTVVAGDSSRAAFSFVGTTTPATGSVLSNGCTITLQHNSTDGRVQAQVDRCSQTGSATIQPGVGTTKFTITDRDMRNNTCTCK